MSIEFVQAELLDAGLHEESVERLLHNFEDMRFHLANENYTEAGAHVGNFCENLANIIIKETGEEVNPHIGVDNFLNGLNGQFSDDLDDAVRITIPNAMRIAYDLRNKRDSVHVNLEVPVNHSDTQTAVRLCTWMLSELLRVYGSEDDVDQIASHIEAFAAPNTPYIDDYNGKRLVMSQELDVREEILVHLQAIGREVDAETLADWIIESDVHSVKSTLGRLKQSRKVHYEDGTAKITPLGVEEAEEIIEENFDGAIQSIERRDEQMAE